MFQGTIASLKMAVKIKLYFSAANTAQVLAYTLEFYDILDQCYWRVSEASETLSGLFNRKS